MHRVCPICHSDEVTQGLVMITGQYTCQNCGYSGSFILEMDDAAYEKLLSDDAENHK